MLNDRFPLNCGLLTHVQCIYIVQVTYTRTTQQNACSIVRVYIRMSDCCVMRKELETACTFFDSLSPSPSLPPSLPPSFLSLPLDAGLSLYSHYMKHTHFSQRSAGTAVSSAVQSPSSSSSPSFSSSQTTSTSVAPPAFTVSNPAPATATTIAAPSGRGGAQKPDLLGGLESDPFGRSCILYSTCTDDMCTSW